MLLALSVLVIATAVMTHITLLTSSRMLTSLDREEEIQNKWITRSSTLMLPKASALLSSTTNSDHLDSDAIQETSKSSRRFTYTLHDQLSLTLILEDENTKVHPAALKKHLPNKLLEQLLSEALAESSSSAGDQLRLNRLQGLNLEAIESWHSYDEVFSNFSPEQIVSSNTTFNTDNTQQDFPLTLWSDGKLNVNATSARLISLLCQPHLSEDQAIQLKEELSSGQEVSLDQALSKLTLTQAARQSLSDRLTLNSKCWRLWIILDNGRRQYHRLFILDQSSQEQARLYSFIW